MPYRYKVAYILLFFSIIISVTSGQPTQQKRKNIAVLDLEGRGITNNEALTLTDRLRGELIKTNQYQVIERGQMEEILKEQGFQQTGCTSQECVVEMGQLMGVQGMVAGSVGKVGNTFMISLRLVSVESGRIIKQVDHDIKGEIDEVLLRGMKEVAYKLAGLKLAEEAQPQRRTPPKVKKKRSKWVYVVGVAAFGLAGGGAYVFYTSRSQEQEVKTGTVGVSWE